MIQRLRIYESACTDPYTNLATEKRLMDITAPGECILYLWQNQNTVVIGRNQNPWVECRTALLEAEGGKLARRLSGGGAVFHDSGNLNFTFLMNHQDYDVDRQLSVIQAACKMAGITAEKSGRNDLLASGRKFSGNAFYHSATHAYHHGTLLISADMDKLQRYLSPSKAKLEAKGVSSVRSRVVNLNTLSPSLTCQIMKEYMAAAFRKVYGLPAETVSLTQEDRAAIDSLRAEYSSWEYLYGTPLPFTFDCQSRFPWGSIQLQLQAKNGIITAAKVYSDAMDWQLPSAVEQALTGCRFCLTDMTQRLRAALSDPQLTEDLCELLSEQEL
jgi:lipoate-protein ligase A